DRPGAAHHPDHGDARRVGARAGRDRARLDLRVEGRPAARPARERVVRGRGGARPRGRRARARAAAVTAARARVGLALALVLGTLVAASCSAPKPPAQAPVESAKLRAQVLVDSGNAAFRNADFAAAAKRYAAAAVVNPDDPAAFYGLGMAL